MAIPLEGRLMLRRQAPFHVQLELERGDQPTVGEMQLQGRVVRAFRTDGRLGCGDHVKFPLWVCQKGDEPTGPAFVYGDALRSAAYMEAYLTGVPPDLRLAAYEFRVIGAPTDHPLLTPEELERAATAYGSHPPTKSQLPNRKTWKFWKRGA